jgi:hypothetical protein
MDDILEDLDFCFAYVDDILVFSRCPRNTINTFGPSSLNSKITVFF